MHANTQTDRYIDAQTDLQPASKLYAGIHTDIQTDRHTTSKTDRQAETREWRKCVSYTRE